jgi:hypothetical protein
MIRGTTPTFTFELPEDMVYVLGEICIAFSQKAPEYTKAEDVVIEKHLKDCKINEQENKISVTLTQQDTLKLDSKKPVWFQLKVLSSGGDVVTSQVWQDEVYPILCEGVLKK